MIGALTSLAAGLLFGAGLAISGMINPAKVIGFLDILGAWDPTLAFVMGGALAVMVPAWLVQRRQQAPLFAMKFEVPARTGIDPKLAGGAVLFGVGWGLVGFCPGPAISALGLGVTSVYIFVAAMFAGMVVYELIQRPAAGAAAAADA